MSNVVHLDFAKKQTISEFTPAELNEYIIDTYRAVTHPTLSMGESLSLLRDLLTFLYSIPDGGTHVEYWEFVIKQHIEKKKAEG